MIRYQGEDVPATTQNPEPEFHEYMERMITAMDGSLLIAFKTCAENGTEWNGDAEYSKVFELWLMSQKILMENEHENVNAESDDEGEDDDDHQLIDLQNIDNQIYSEFMQDGQPVLVFRSDEDAQDFVESQESALAPVECIETLPSTSASAQAAQQNNAESFKLDTSRDLRHQNKPNDIIVQLEADGSFKSALEVLQDTFPVKERPTQKRIREKKPSVLSDSTYIQKRKDILEVKQQKEHAKMIRKAIRNEKRAQQESKPKPRAKKPKSDSWMVSRTPTSESAPCTPTPERRKAVRRIRNNRDLFSPSSSAPATPSSADSFPHQSTPNKPLFKLSVKRPLRFIDSD